MTPVEGARTVEFLLGRRRLERIDGSSAVVSAGLVAGRAGRRLLTAEGGLRAGDFDGAFAASYDAYRMAAEALLVCQGLRATGGEGSHVTVEDAVSAQFSGVVPVFAKPTFERFRRARHAAQYFDPSAPDISEDDARWALRTAQAAVAGVAAVLGSDPPGLYGGS